MPTLKDLWQNTGRHQRSYIEKKLRDLGTRPNSEELARGCLQTVWIRYDTGGISMGRALRAAMLEEILPLMRCGFLDEAKELLALLIAMYHSPDYMNDNKWYDYTITKDTLPLEERVLLVCAGEKLSIVEIPDISVCTHEHVTLLIHKAKEKIRAFAKGG